MQWLANISVKRPIFATVLMLVLCVIGWVGYQQLAVDRFPKVDFPVIAVIARLPGAAPQEMETDVADKLEEAVNTVSGIDELRSISSEGVAQIFVQFQLDKNIDVAAQEVRDRVSAALPDLPRDIVGPTVNKIDPDATPVLYIAVNADKPIREITELADKVVRRRLESVDGVGQVNVVGGQKRQINIWLDPVKLRGAGLSPSQVQRALEGQNLSLPAGRIETGPEFLTLRVRGRVESSTQINDLVLKREDDHLVRVRDVARVEDAEESAETAAVQDGKAAVVLSIRKQSGSNTVAVVDSVRERMTEIGAGLPVGYRLEVVRDNSATIRTSVHAVQEHLIVGALLAALVVLVFLGNLRSTVIAAIAIPISIVGTFALIWLKGFTLDTITLLALALAVGIVIDDAIVVLENIVRFIEEKQMAPMEAAIAATKDIGLAVLATTLSLVAVFLPVAFMGGIVGRFLNSFGLTMAFSIAISMLVSFSLTPMLAARWLKPLRVARDGQHRKSVLERVVDHVYRPLEIGYMKVLRGAMRYRFVVVLLGLLALGATVPLMGLVEKEFLPKSDEAHFEVNVRAPEGQSLEQTSLTTERIAREIRELSGVRSTLVTIGDNNQKTPNQGRIYVRLVDPGERKQSQHAMMDQVRKQVLARQPKTLRLDVSEVPMFNSGFATALIQYELTGPDLDALQGYASKAQAALAKMPGAVDVDSNLIPGKPELQISVRRDRAASLGIQIADIANTVRMFIGDVEVSNYEENGEQYEVHVRADERFRASVESLALLTVPSSTGTPVPLLDLVDVKHESGPSQIQRYNRRRQITLLANVAPGYSEGEIVAKLGKVVADLNMPAGYSAGPVGRSKEMGKAQGAFLLAFGLSFIFMYLTLAAQFESWLHPITILLSLPLTLPFALMSLILFGQSFNIYSGLGILVLFGVVKKNAILQIDHTNHLRSTGMPRAEAILEANRDRLRPILMTTLAFVMGMLPLLWSTGIGAGFNGATAGPIVGGQILSLLLTLLATPVAYSLFDDATHWLKKWWPNSQDAADPPVGVSERAA
jgi:hydrophobic/amphiphilic exporter-1 (mainly G- bacteria), HAE1 family